MTLIEEPPVQAGYGLNLLEGIPVDSGSPVALTGMQVNPQLEFCETNRFPVSNCPLPKFWVDECRADEEGIVQEVCVDYEERREEFEAFRWYDAVESPCVDPLYPLTEITDATVTEGTAWAITTELQSGVSTGNPSLQSTATDISAASGAAVAPGAALAKLMQAIRKRGLARVTLHVPWEALPALQAQGLVRTVGSTLRAPGNILVNAAPGLTGVGPDTTGNVDETDDLRSYFYMTRGLVEYKVSELNREQLEHERINMAFGKSNRRGVLRFDTECVYAVKACLNMEAHCG